MKVMTKLFKKFPKQKQMIETMIKGIVSRDFEGLFVT
jgi:hypothetical protein